MTRLKYKEAIGLEVKRGKPAKGKKPSKSDLQKLYVRESKSIREVADVLGCSKDMVYRTLKECRIERRPHTWNPKLERFDIEFLKETVNKIGYRKGAEELGIDKSTLYRYLKKQEK